MDQSERRQYQRIRKNYFIQFTDKNNSSASFETTQVDNISKGGVAFTSTHPIEPNMEIVVKIRTPYLADPLTLEGITLETTEKVKGMIYKTRVEFKNVNEQAEAILEKIEQYYGKEE